MRAYYFGGYSVYLPFDTEFNMKLIPRLVVVAARAMIRSNLSVLELSHCNFRVLPTDLDVNFHMNNGRFLQIMDLARIDWLLRTGILQNALCQHRRLVLGGVIMRYVRELRVLQRYTVATRLIGWDRKFFYIEHKFETRDGRAVAVGVVRAAQCTADGIVPAGDVAADHGQGSSPPLPAYIQSWNDADMDLRKQGQSAGPGGRVGDIAPAAPGEPHPLPSIDGGQVSLAGSRSPY
jgi:acyl-CoA thioesterase FadM